ncbi:MAG: hypothetical protein ACI9VR_001886 [Cognaticolwellia sp.]|jgi:hypothetical protein
MAKAKRQTPQQKVLRIGVVQDGKIVQERLIKANEEVTVGESTKNLFVFPPTSLPKRFQLFQPKKGGGYILHFTDGMEGKISYKNAIVPLEQLKQRGDAVRKGTDFVLPLSEGNRGKVSVDGVTILFQFVPPPPEPMRAGAKMDFRPKLIEEDDPVFFGFLGLFTALATVLMIYVYNAEPVERVAIEEIPDRFTEIILEPSDDEPPEVIEPEVDPDAEGEKIEREDAAAADEAEPAAADKTPPTQAEKEAAAEARRAKAKAEVANNPLLAAIIGTRGESGSEGKVQDLFGSADFAGQDLDAALASVTGVDVATEAGLKAKEGAGGGPRTTAGIGALKGGSTGEAGVGTGPATAVKGGVQLGQADAMLEEGDTSSVTKIVRKYSGQVKYCYEAQLKNDPSLSGRVEVQFTVNKGRVASASVFGNSTGSDPLAKCIVGKVRKWKFPEEIQGDIVYPFVLSPSN